MARSRVLYQQWIVDLGREPAQPTQEESSTDDRRQIIREAVREALQKLNDDQREFIERFYYMGMCYEELAERTGRTMHRLEAIHKTALRRLRKELQPFVAATFGIDSEVITDCPICASPYRDEIDQLIAAKPESATWSGVMQELAERFDLRITTPQTLIGHSKYH